MPMYVGSCVGKCLEGKQENKNLARKGEQLYLHALVNAWKENRKFKTKQGQKSICVVLDQVKKSDNQKECQAKKVPSKKECQAKKSVKQKRVSSKKKECCPGPRK